jgi:hypothetical protein
MNSSVWKYAGASLMPWTKEVAVRFYVATYNPARNYGTPLEWINRIKTVDIIT